MKTFETKTCSPKPCTNAPKCEPVACETSWGAWGACTDECDVANGKRYRQLQARGQTLFWVLWRQFETATHHSTSLKRQPNTSFTSTLLDGQDCFALQILKRPTCGGKDCPKTLQEVKKCDSPVIQNCVEQWTNWEQEKGR